MDLAQGGVADAAARLVDDALEGEIVGGLVDQAQIGERVAHLLAFVEAQAPQHAIGQAQLDEAFLEFAGLEAGADQDRDLAQGRAAALQGLDLLADLARLLLAVPDAADADLVADLAVGMQRLAEPALVMGDQPRGGGQDMAGGAVVALEADDPGAGKIALEAQDVAHLRPAPAIDRLVVVADAAEVAPALGQEAQPQILRDIAVLILVHQDVAELLLILGQHLRLLGEERQIVQQQIAEIAGVQIAQALLILAVEPERDPVGIIRLLRRGHLVRGEAAVLPALDGREQGARRPFLVVQILGDDELLQQAELIVGIEDGEIGREADHLGMAAQQPGGQRMEGAEPPALHRPADEGRDPVLHLAGRLVGEGDGEQLLRPGLAGHQDMAEAGRQHPGLAGARPGQDQDRAFGRLDGLALGFVQRFEIGRCHQGRVHDPEVLGGAVIRAWVARSPRQR